MLVKQKMCFTCYLQAVNTNAPEEKTKHETYRQQTCANIKNYCE